MKQTIRVEAPETTRDSSSLAKLSRPKLFGALPRERLFRTLDEHRAHPVVWVGGPPGAGKTTLVASYIEARQLPGIWYHVDSGDSDPAAFFYYMGLAAAQAAPGEQEPLPLLTPEHLADLSGFSRRFFRELYARLPRPAVLVLDDSQEVLAESTFHALLVDSASEIPEGLNVILISRGEPPSLYTRLLANRALALVDWHDLRLTAEEARGIASAFSSDEALLETLHRQSGGWAAGFTLMLERLRRNGIAPGRHEAETREAVFSYFAGEILDRATPEDRHILVSTAFLPSMTAAMAEQLSGSPRASQLLQQLYRRQLFTNCNAGSPSNYQYHDLFRQFLLARAEQTYTRDELKQIARRAAALLEDQGDLEQAVLLHARSESWDEATGVILKQGERLLAQGRGQTLRDWIAALPEEQVARTPWLSYWQGTSLIRVNQTDARAALARAWDGFKHAGDETGQRLTAAGIIETHQHEWSTLAPLDPWIDVLDALVERDTIFPSRDAELRVYSALLMALVNARPGHRLFSVCLDRLKVMLEDDLDLNQRIFTAQVLLGVHCLNLDVDAARELRGRLEGLLGHADAAQTVRLSAMSQIAFSLWLEQAHTEAAQILQEAMAVAEGTGLKTADPFLFFTRHLLAVGQRDQAAMESNIQELRQILDPTRRLGLGMLSRALADRAVLQGDAAGAIEHGETAVSLADEAGARPLQSMWRLGLAATLIEDGTYDEAARRLDEARSVIGKASFDRSLRDHDLLEACVCLRRGDRPGCHRMLAQALARSKSGRAASHVFVLYPRLMSEVCAEALRAGLAVDQVENLIKQYRLAPPSLEVDAWPWPIKIYSLGHFSVIKDGEPIRFARRTQKRPLELLQALIAFGGIEVAVSTLTEALWPDAEGDTAYHAFESVLYRLRQLLGSAGALVLVGGKLSLDARCCWVDVWAFERQLDAARPDGANPEQSLERLRQLYRGHFLEQESEKFWALATREAMREKFLLRIQSVAALHEAAKRWQEAAAIYQRGIELDNLAERLYRGLMICHRELGNHAEALKTYRRCRELLSVVLGVQPNAQTQAVYQSLKQSSVERTTPDRIEVEQRGAGIERTLRVPVRKVSSTPQRRPVMAEEE
jgi:ATP/maltotriose-dependent transcriptional regulator MalT/DNA-binding SARP family transcriptional activator